MTYTEFTFIASTAGFLFPKFSSSHEIMVEDASGLDYIKDKVAKREEEIIFHAEWEKSVLKSMPNRMNSLYSRNWKSLDDYLYCK